ncbi:MAG: hypothetical protein AAGD22_09380 [Verrucomicrobiota bacterium]
MNTETAPAHRPTEPPTEKPTISAHQASAAQAIAGSQAAKRAEEQGSSPEKITHLLDAAATEESGDTVCGIHFPPRVIGSLYAIQIIGQSQSADLSPADLTPATIIAFHKPIETYQRASRSEFAEIVQDARDLTATLSRDQMIELITWVSRQCDIFYESTERPRKTPQSPGESEAPDLATPGAIPSQSVPTTSIPSGRSPRSAAGEMPAHRPAETAGS